METLVLRLRPLTAFGSPLLGDTLFGQLCWAARHRFGTERLTALLAGYTAGRPFAVVSDAFPEGVLPRPALPLSLFREIPGADRKQAKRRHWIPLAALSAPLLDWLGQAQGDAQLLGALQTPSPQPPPARGGGVSATSRQRTPSPLAGEGRGEGDKGLQNPAASLLLTHPQPHNSLNRLTGTTGRGEFAPYNQMQRWHAPEVALVCRVVFDPERLDAEALTQLFADIGASGFGRDASIGLGKFDVEAILDAPWPHQDNANACLTLAPCAPQGLAWDADRCFYEVFTRFGRHGDLAVHEGNPFKTPLLLARAGAVLTPPQMPEAPFIGQGLGGDGSLSKVIPETVHQGYAPCIPIHLPLLEVAA